MYTRRDVCAHTGMGEGQFKNLARRDQLPFERLKTLNSEEYLDVVGARGWNRFSAVDVLFIAVQHRLMVRIGEADGLPPETARVLVSNCGTAIARLLDSPTSSDQWIGYVGQPITRGGNDSGFPVFGSFFEVAEKISHRNVTAADPTSPGIFETDPAAERVFLINVSEVLRGVRARAHKAGVQFPARAQDNS